MDIIPVPPLENEGFKVGDRVRRAQAEMGGEIIGFHGAHALVSWNNGHTSDIHTRHLTLESPSKRFET